MPTGRRALGLAAAAVVVLLAACAGGSGSQVRGVGTQGPLDAEAGSRAATPVLDLAVRLEQHLAAASPGSDVTVAPLPVASSLAQARVGAAGTTAEELDRVLGAASVEGGAATLASGVASLDRIVRSRSGTQRDASGRTGTVSVDLVDGLWLPKDTPFEQGWLDELATTWDAGVHTTDFRSDPETARRAMNDWASSATRGHIDQLVPRGSVPPTTRLVAAGAAYLKAPWLTPFDEARTRLAPFRHLDSTTTTVPMMRNPGLRDVRLGTGDGWTAVDLPYLGRDLWMTVIVPADGRFGEVEAGLDGSRLGDLLASLTPATVDLSLPRFGFTTDAPLTDALRDLGLADAMDPLAADLTGISPEPLSISSVLQQTYLAVAEQGTEATATNPTPPAPSTTAGRASTSTSTGTTGTTGTTGSTGGGGSAVAPSGVAPSTPSATVVTVDRPFLVVVRDRSSGAPLLYGRVLSPNG